MAVNFTIPPNDPHWISKEDLVALTISASPSFKAIADRQHYEPSESTWLDDHGDIAAYLLLGDFANHIVDLYSKDELEEFDAIFDLIERLHVKGDGHIREAATIGLLEGIQNCAPKPELFESYLKPVSKRWWDSLNDFWSGNKPLVD